VTPRHPPEGRELLHELASKGIRLTAQRRALIEVIQEAREHLDVASLLQIARKKTPRVNRATVYRTIELLKRLRLIDELDLMHLQGEKHYYEAAGRREHLHLACFHCGRIEEFTSPIFEHLKAEVTAQSGFDIRVIRLEAGGRCKACIESSPRRPEETDRSGKPASVSKEPVQPEGGAQPQGRPR
jgi:Fur family transcriptional regulator, ferric uptake regulator